MHYYYILQAEKEGQRVNHLIPHDGQEPTARRTRSGLALIPG